MKEEFTPFDIASLLEDGEAIEDFLKDAVEEGDATLVAHAIGIVARAKGMTRIAGETGLAREALYRSFSEDGNPSLKSTIAVLKSLGFVLSVRAISSDMSEAGEASEAAE